MIKILQVPEVAQALRVSEEHVRDLIRDKKLIGYKEGRRGGWKIPEFSLVNYLRERFDGSFTSNSKNNHLLLPAHIMAH